MTFEEFFLKKKIDLELFKQGKPDMFAEFIAHYEVMSEKSFDHTKKYWFNNLRIAYPLSEEKELELKDAYRPKLVEQIVTEKVIEQAGKENSPAITTKAPAFKPRFKAPTTTTADPLNTDLKAPADKDGSDTAPPSGFKPRFKASVTASFPKADEEKAESLSEEQSTEEKPIVVKPAAFKPRFKAEVTASAPNAEEEKSESLSEETPIEEKPTVAKPAGIKPRFKAGVTASAPKAEEKKTAEVKEETPAEENPVASQPTGFKPRFKVGKTASTPKVEVETSEPAQEETPEEEKPTVAKPAGFKPRFKAPKKDE